MDLLLGIRVDSRINAHNIVNSHLTTAEENTTFPEGSIYINASNEFFVNIHIPESVIYLRMISKWVCCRHNKWPLNLLYIYQTYFNIVDINFPPFLIYIVIKDLYHNKIDLPSYLIYTISLRMDRFSRIKLPINLMYLYTNTFEKFTNQPQYLTYLSYAGYIKPSLYISLNNKDPKYYD
jgi:hypothetical protein